MYSLNLCKGVVTHEDFSSESEEDLKSFFEPEGVVNVHRIRQKVDGIFVPLTTLILTFDKPLLPDRIRCGFFNLRVWQYVPIPCAVLSVRGLDILRSTACLKQFVYLVARRHIVLLASLHHIASTVMVLMVQILVIFSLIIYICIPVTESHCHPI